MTLAAVLCCMISTTVLTSCMDKVDNPVPQEPTMVDPVVDIYLHDDDMDRDVRPGDSFYHFAVGSWIKSHDPKDVSWITEGIEYINSIAQNALTNSEDPQVKQQGAECYVRREWQSRRPRRMGHPVRHGLFHSRSTCHKPSKQLVLLRYNGWCQ